MARVAARGSTDIVATRDRLVAEAVRFIRRRVGQPIRVCDVVVALPTSRRSLETRFRKALRRSPHDEILRIRVERLKQFLAGTDMSIEQVTASAGFTYPAHMAAVFRRKTGMTPTAFRRQVRRTG